MYSETKLRKHIYILIEGNRVTHNIIGFSPWSLSPLQLSMSMQNNYGNEMK